MPIIDTYDFHGMSIQVHAATNSSDEAHPHLALNAPHSLRVLGAGAIVECQSPPRSGMANLVKGGNFLTGSWPANGAEWSAQAKDHEVSCPGRLTVFIVAADVPPEHHVIVQNTSLSANHPSVEATLPPEFVLVGGGARANWKETGGAGSLLHASRPSSGQSWFAASKDHRVPSPTTVTAFAIGLRRAYLDQLGLKVVRVVANSEMAVSQPSVICRVEDEMATLISGGAQTHWSTAGCLLTAAGLRPGSAPQSLEVIARGKDHFDPDPSAISAWGLALVKCR